MRCGVARKIGWKKKKERPLATDWARYWKAVVTDPQAPVARWEGEASIRRKKGGSYTHTSREIDKGRGSEHIIVQANRESAIYREQGVQG